MDIPDCLLDNRTQTVINPHALLLGFARKTTADFITFKFTLDQAKLGNYVCGNQIKSLLGRTANALSIKTRYAAMWSLRLPQRRT